MNPSNNNNGMHGSGFSARYSRQGPIPPPPPLPLRPGHGENHLSQPGNGGGGGAPPPSSSNHHNFPPAPPSNGNNQQQRHPSINNGGASSYHSFRHNHQGMPSDSSGGFPGNPEMNHPPRHMMGSQGSQREAPPPPPPFGMMQPHGQGRMPPQPNMSSSMNHRYHPNHNYYAGGNGGGGGPSSFPGQQHSHAPPTMRHHSMHAMQHQHQQHSQQFRQGHNPHFNEYGGDDHRRVAYPYPQEGAFQRPFPQQQQQQRHLHEGFPPSRPGTDTPSSQMSFMQIGPDRCRAESEMSQDPPPPPPLRPPPSRHAPPSSLSYHDHHDIRPFESESRSPSPSGIPPPPKLRAPYSEPAKLRAPVATRITKEDLLGPLRESRRFNVLQEAAAEERDDTTSMNHAKATDAPAPLPHHQEDARDEQQQQHLSNRSAPLKKPTVSVQDASLLLGLRSCGSGGSPTNTSVQGIEESFSMNSQDPSQSDPSRTHNDMTAALDPTFHSFPARVPKNYPTRLALAGDNAKLNSLHCFIRTHLLEIFVVEQTKNMSAANNPNSALGRVGLRCVHCALARKRATVEDKNEAPMAVFYPKSVSEIYRLVTSWQRCHLRKCRSLPPDLRREWDLLRETDKTRGKTSYWITSAKQIGLVDCQSRAGGVRFNLPEQEGGPAEMEDPRHNNEVASVAGDEIRPSESMASSHGDSGELNHVVESSNAAADMTLTESASAESEMCRAESRGDMSISQTTTEEDDEANAMRTTSVEPSPPPQDTA